MQMSLFYGSPAKGCQCKSDLVQQGRDNHGSASPIHDALELHVEFANYQVKMRLQSDVITTVTLPPRG